MPPRPIGSGPRSGRAAARPQGHRLSISRPDETNLRPRNIAASLEIRSAGSRPDRLEMLRRSLALVASLAALAAGSAAAARGLGLHRHLLRGARRLRRALPLHGHGWGHGVGMSQYGAYGYAQHGSTYEADPRPLLPGHDARAGAGDDDPRAARRQEEGADDRREPALSPSATAPATRRSLPAAEAPPSHAELEWQRAPLTLRCSRKSGAPHARPPLPRPAPRRRRRRPAPRARHRRARAVPLRRRPVGDAVRPGRRRR